MTTLAECPKCHGTGNGAALTLFEKLYTWNKERTHHPCNNCGGQYMYGKPSGMTHIDPSTGLGCMHEYKHSLLGRCYHGYRCDNCGDNFTIDSGD